MPRPAAFPKQSRQVLPLIGGQSFEGPLLTRVGFAPVGLSKGFRDALIIKLATSFDDPDQPLVPIDMTFPFLSACVAGSVLHGDNKWASGVRQHSFGWSPPYKVIEKVVVVEEIPLAGE
jgi:hypothetical protein